MIRTSGSLVFGLLAALLCNGSGLAANKPMADPADPWDRVRSIAPGRKIVVEMFEPPRGKAKVTFVSASDDAIVVRAKDSRETVVPKEKIRKVKLRGSRGKNSLLGLAIGGGVGFLMGAIVDRGGGDDPYSGRVILGGLGLLAGFVAGVSLPASKTVYEAPKGSRQARARDRNAPSATGLLRVP